MADVWIVIVLEAAERLKARRFDRDVIVAIFDAEEPPHFLQQSMGSTAFYSEQRREKIECAFILDLVGHDIPIAGMEPQSSSQAWRAIRNSNR